MNDIIAELESYVNGEPEPKQKEHEVTTTKNGRLYCKTCKKFVKEDHGTS